MSGILPSDNLTALLERLEKYAENARSIGDSTAEAAFNAAATELRGLSAYLTARLGERASTFATRCGPTTNAVIGAAQYAYKDAVEIIAPTQPKEGGGSRPLTRRSGCRAQDTLPMKPGESELALKERLRLALDDVDRAEATLREIAALPLDPHEPLASRQWAKLGKQATEIAAAFFSPPTPSTDPS